ncbi:MAG: DUF1080 domain-containing protein [Bryobacteraceae bacterium]|nr:DUF1080 domain-containing protein [Bryobacteraceae bacterium]
MGAFLLATAWLALFDGTLEQFLPASPSWVVEDGTLAARPHGRNSEYLVTRSAWRAFELEFEYKLDKGANSGVKYLVQHYDRSGRNEVLYGVEFQLIDEAHKDAGPPENRTGALYNLLAPVQSPALPAGEWNRARLVVRGAAFEHWINGVRVLEGDLDSPEMRAIVLSRWGKGRPGTVKALLERKRTECPVAFQNHGDAPVWFRAIRLRPL